MNVREGLKLPAQKNIVALLLQLETALNNKYFHDFDIPLI